MGVGIKLRGFGPLVAMTWLGFALLLAGSAEAADGDSGAKSWQGLWQDRPWQPEGDGAGYGAEDQQKAELELEGGLEFRYVFRTTDEGRDLDSDQDFYTRLDARIDYGLWGAELEGMVPVDMDGRGDDNSPFFNVNDSFDNGRPYLYRAFVERRELGPLGVIRVGRQVHQPGTESYRHDGAYLETVPFEHFVFDLFGGVPAHLYESNQGGDWLLGADVTWRPQRSTSVRLGYVHIDDDRKHTGTRHDNRYDLTVIHRIEKTVKLRGDVATIDGDATETRLRALIQLVDWDLKIGAGYLGRFGSWRNLTTEYSYYDEILVRYEDHVQFDLSLTKGLLDHLVVDVAGTIREIVDGDEGPFNHEYGRWRAGLSTPDWPLEELTLSAYATGWHSDTDDIVTWGGEVSYRPMKELRLAVGTDFALYEVDRFIIKEREHVRSFFFKGRWRIHEHLEAKLGLDFEKDDEEFYFTTDVALRLVF